MNFDVRNSAIEGGIVKLTDEDIQGILVEEIKKRMSGIVSGETINNMVHVLSETEKQEIIRKYITTKVDEALLSQGGLSKQRKGAYLGGEDIKIGGGEGAGGGGIFKSSLGNRGNRYSGGEDSRISGE